MKEFNSETGWRWKEDGITYQEYFKEKGMHHCEKNLPYAGYGAALDECYECVDDRLVVGNGEYTSQVNFCPICGYKAKRQIIE